MTPEEIEQARRACEHLRVARPSHHVHCAGSVSVLLDRTEEAIGLLRVSERRASELEIANHTHGESMSKIAGELQSAVDAEDRLESRVAELVESEEKAWQTVAKLRVELETTARLRRRLADRDVD